MVTILYIWQYNLQLIGISFGSCKFWLPILEDEGNWYVFPFLIQLDELIIRDHQFFTKFYTTYRLLDWAWHLLAQPYPHILMLSYIILAIHMSDITIHEIKLCLVSFKCILANTIQILYNVLYQIEIVHNYDKDLLFFALTFLNISLSIFNTFQIDPNQLKMFVLSYSMWGAGVEFITPF